MNRKIVIRNEEKSDRCKVEQLTRRAFYNIYVPGCSEHYLVHIMRDHEDFIPQLDFVLELDGEIIGNIMYTKAKLTDENGFEKTILTFGPVCIAPEYQRKGYGKMLIRHSLDRAVKLGYDTVVIFGNPFNYVSCGFKSCKRYHIRMDGQYPTAMLVKELVPDVLDGREWSYASSPVMTIDEKEAQAYDDSLEKMEKKVLPQQEAFFIMSHSSIQ